MRTNYRYNARMRFQTIKLRYFLSMLVWLCGLLTIGCGPPAELHLIQPHLPVWQKHIHLSSQDAYWSPGEQMDRVLLEFPLPGATSGRPTYILYLRLPSGIEEPTVAENPSPTARGFLIQTRGDYAGLALITKGKIKVKGTSKSSKAKRKLEFEFDCEDGSRLLGKAQAKRNDWYIQRFETQRRAADVEALMNNQTIPEAKDNTP